VHLRCGATAPTDAADLWANSIRPVLPQVGVSNRPAAPPVKASEYAHPRYYGLSSHTYLTLKERFNRCVVEVKVKVPGIKDFQASPRPPEFGRFDSNHTDIAINGNIGFPVIQSFSGAGVQHAQEIRPAYIGFAIQEGHQVVFFPRNLGYP